ncbi:MULTISPECIES: ABC transporter substrate-binding protein [Hyphomicrobiales]|uniref:ABC transporter substrate-binding protein n=1 Tax=Hyphomicrobiales TaxID=356 RepID=UPI001C0CD3C8|nr:PotD/PotF family extracellular solute-binding protein [Rhizobium sp. X9]MCH4541901.1 PotD/PotF family extracellular solute-binding protein [Ochrobactrum sp. A-1]
MKKDKDTARLSLTRRTFLTVAGGAALAAPMVLKAQAADSGEVVVMGWAPYWTAEMTQLFKAKTGLKLRMIGAAADQEMFTKVRAGGAGDYDLVYANAGWTPVYNQAGLIEPIAIDEVKASSNLYPEFLNTASLPFVSSPGKELLFYPNMWSPLAMVWLDSAIKAPDTVSWKMLWDASIKPGTILLGGGGGDDFLAVGGLALGLKREEVYSMSAEQLDTVVANMRKLKPFQILSGAEQEFRARFRSGKATIGLASQIGVAALINAEAKEDIAKAAIPVEGSLGWVDGPMLMKNAKNRANAMAFLEFIGSDVDYGKMIFKETGGSPCSRTVTEAIVAGGGDDAQTIKTIQADNPALATQVVMQAPPADPVAYAEAWDKVLAS